MPIRKLNFWIIIILTAGILYVLSLHLLISDGVYFIGDAGLKSMISQNLASGSLAFDLKLPDPPWIKALWGKGMYPYEEPYVYQIAGKYFTQYPYTFPLITAPFYAAFGFRGLYLIPLISTVIIWLIFYRLCRRLDLDPGAIAIGLFFLIFPTNLSLFGALYWEHTLSVCLAFAGLACFFPKKGAERIGVWAMIGSGILTGLAVWFRPEQVFLVIFLSLICLFSFGKAVFGGWSKPWLDLGKVLAFIGKRGWIYLVSSVSTLLLYGLTNWLIYQNFLGVHSVQVLGHETFKQRFATFVENLRIITVGDTSFFLFTPIALFLLGFLLFAFIRRGQLKYERDWTIWYAFCLVFIPGVAVLVPLGAGGKQWGPRFLLILVPVVTLLFTWQIDRLIKNPNRLSRTARWLVWASIAVLGIAGIIQDPFRGRDYIIYNYNQQKPAIEALRADHEPVIAVSNYYLSQVFQPALGREVTFLAAINENQMASLSKALLDQNQDTFTYICYSFDCKLFPPGVTTAEVKQNGVGYQVQTLVVRDYGKYTIRKVQVSSRQ